MDPHEIGDLQLRVAQVEERAKQLAFRAETQLQRLAALERAAETDRARVVELEHLVAEQAAELDRLRSALAGRG